jgi:hypothetical protein
MMACQFISRHSKRQLRANSVSLYCELQVNASSENRKFRSLNNGKPSSSAKKLGKSPTETFNMMNTCTVKKLSTAVSCL